MTTTNENITEREKLLAELVKLQINRRGRTFLMSEDLMMRLRHHLSVQVEFTNNWLDQVGKKLRNTDAQLIRILAHSTPDPVSVERITSTLFIAESTLRMKVLRLRKILRKDCKIITDWGVGYRLIILNSEEEE